MKSKTNEYAGWLLFATIKRLCQLGVIIVLSIIISSVIVDYRESEIRWEIWKAFDAQREIDMKKFQRENGIIDNDIIQFEDEKRRPVNI